MGKNIYIGIIGMIILVGILFFVIANGNDFVEVNNFEGEMIIYKSSSCGCCGLFGGYFKQNGNSNVKIVNLGDEELESMKENSGIPMELQSCHTTIIGDYFVEGHMPLEAIEKLLSEKPDIAGIALPGMPEGSPGMPGIKRMEWIIYSVNHDGTSQEFMRF